MPERPPDQVAEPLTSAECADPLSAVLRAVRLRGAIYFNVRASTPWTAEAPESRVLAPLVMPGAQHVIEYHVVKRGTCFGGLANGPAVELGEGDVIVFPHGDAHVMSSAPDMRARVAPGEGIDRFLATTTERPPFALAMGSAATGSAPTAEVVCGFLGCDARPFNPLVAALPRVLHVRAGAAGDGARLRALIELTELEAAERRAGGDCVLARLSELLFIEVVRRHLQSLPSSASEESGGWLAGLRDPIVGRALALLHARPARAWTLDLLAREAFLSRSALAERFKTLVGAPPMQYLAQWRMQIAAGMLAEGDANVASIATEVGYGSEAAFSRAFKKLVGVPPAAWREHASR